MFKGNFSCILALYVPFTKQQAEGGSSHPRLCVRTTEDKEAPFSLVSSLGLAAGCLGLGSVLLV